MYNLHAAAYYVAGHTLYSMVIISQRSLYDPDHVVHEDFFSNTPIIIIIIANLVLYMQFDHDNYP